MVKVIIRSASGFTEKQLEKAKSSMQLLEKVLNSVEFKKEILNADFIKTKKYSNKQIYDLIIEGRESLDPTKDNEVDLYLNLSNDNPHEIGHTENQKNIFTGREIFKEMSEAEYAGHIAHEYCHTLGFSHPFFRLPRRSRTVPYLVGNIVEEIATNL